MKRLGLIAALILSLAISLLGIRSVGPLPPLYGLLDPWSGAWQVAVMGKNSASLQVAMPGLQGEVEVQVDTRGVPHIFATTEQDAWRVQGWLVARDRLFQLNLQTRATAGRLTEWVGGRALQADRRSRRMGLARAAERQWAALAVDDPSRLAMEAYAEGVNAWIGSVGIRDLPLEFRLLGVRPDPWAPQHALYLFQQMAAVLALEDVAGWRAEVAALVGWEVAEALLPTHSPIQEPIQPNGQFAPRTDLLRLPPPGAPDSLARVTAAWHEQQRGPGDAAADPAGEAIGSNNWAVAASRSAAGLALLAGDPHLSLSLPSIWYEVHLVVPGVLDVAGAALPGAPGVVIGYNRSLAWSVTNTGADVLDLYQESVDDATNPGRYRLDGVWIPLELEEVSYRDPAGKLLLTDTLRFTHRGPMTRTLTGWTSSRWTMHELVPDPHVWIKLDRAGDIAAGLAVTSGYPGPAQNFVMADTTGRIAIRSTGLYPIRPGDGRGDVVRDGSTRASDWIGWQPVDRYPFAIDPSQGYLASANQEPMDSRDISYYLGAVWPTPWRAIRINTLLRSDSTVTPEAMRRFQTDPGSAAADLFVPHLLRAAESHLAQDPQRADLARSAALLAEWDRRYDRDSRRAVLFEQVMQAAGRLLWDELIPAGDSMPRFQPGQDVTGALLQDPENPWWDERRTAEPENRDALLAHALEMGLSSTIDRFGEPDDPRWTWSSIRQMNVRHLMGLEPLSRLGIPTPSGMGTLSPSGGGGTHGASWRMVVELGPEVRAWTTYPGGQSGNPASPWYADRFAQWSVGDLQAAESPRSARDLSPAQVASTLRFRAGVAR